MHESPHGSPAPPAEPLRSSDQAPRPPVLAGQLSWRALGPGLWRCTEARSGGARLVRALAAGERDAGMSSAEVSAGFDRRPATRPATRPAHARLVPGRCVVDGDGVPWVIHDDPGGRPAPSPGAGGPRAGSVATMPAESVADVARAIAALHRSGQVHGAVSPGLVMIAADGGGWLLDAVEAPGSAEADVAHLAALAEWACGPLADVIGVGEAPTTAEGWARRLRSVAEVTPLAGLRAQARAAHESAGLDDRRTWRRGLGRPRRLRPPVLGAVCLVLLVTGLWFVARSQPRISAVGASGRDSAAASSSTPAAQPDPSATVGGPAGAPAQPAARVPPGEAASVPGQPDAGADRPAPPSGDWRAVLAALDAARAQALAAADPGLLAAVDALGSPAFVADDARIQALDAAGLRVIGIERDLVSVVAAEPPVGRPAGGVVWLRVVDRLSAHQIVDPAGAVVEQRPGRAEAAWAVALREVASGWRIDEVAPA